MNPSIESAPHFKILCSVLIPSTLHTRSAGTAAYPWVTTDLTPGRLFAPLDAELDGACSSERREWYPEIPPPAAVGNTLGEQQWGEEEQPDAGGAWSRTMMVGWALFGDPAAGAVPPTTAAVDGADVVEQAVGDGADGADGAGA